MPGFAISNFGGNRTTANHESRFYTTFTWEIPHLFIDDYSNYSASRELGDPDGLAGSIRTKMPVTAPKNYPEAQDGYDSYNGYNAYNASILLKSAQLPAVTFEQVKAKGGSIEYKFAGKPVFDTVKITFYDTYDISRLLKIWSNSIWSPQFGLRTANRYKKKTVITKYLVDRDTASFPDEFNNGKSDGTIRYELFGSWPMVIKESDLTYVEAGIKTIDISIMYDHYTVFAVEE